MGPRGFSIRAKAAVTILGALLVVPTVASALSLRHGGREQTALTSEHAPAMAGTARNPIEVAIAQGRAGRAGGRLGSLGRSTPFEEFRVVERGWDAFGTSRPEDEVLRRAGTPLSDSWDIPPEAQVVGRVGLVVCGAEVPHSEVGGTGARAGPDLPIASRRREAATGRGRTRVMMPAAAPGDRIRARAGRDAGE